MSDVAGRGGHPALMDGETGLPNRLYFDTVFDVIFSTGFRGLPLTVLLLELDGFEEWAGTRDVTEVHRLLRSLGRVVRAVVRKSDVVARTGEARFAFCLIDCNLAGGVLVADRVDGMLDSFRESAGLRFSIGGAVFDSDMQGPSDLLDAAEDSLRSVWAKGGDRVEFHI